MEKPNIFIHYSWDSEEHKKWALELATRLINDGVDVLLDQFDLSIGANETYFMEKLQNANKILLIMTPKYKSKTEERENGVGYEYQIISSLLSENIKANKKILPILKEGSKTESVPVFLQSYIYLDMRNNSSFEERYIELLKNIYEEPIKIKPQLGNRPDFLKIEGETKNNFPEKDIKFGLTKEEVHEILGEPQREFYLSEDYWSNGMKIFYNKHENFVDGILIKRMEPGINYEGEVVGIKLGDSFAIVKSKLGNPLNWGLPNDATTFAIYKIKDNYLTLAIWRNQPEEKIFDFKIGTVFGIAYCGECSILACEPIVALTIEEIRSKKKLSHLEEGKNITIELNSSYFHEKYQMIPPIMGKFGGYFVTAKFLQSNKLVDFWLYDLGWSKLVIRAIGTRESKTNKN